MKGERAIGWLEVDKMIAAALINDGFRDEFTRADRSQIGKLKYQGASFAPTVKVTITLARIIAANQGDLQAIVAQVAEEQNKGR